MRRRLLRCESLEPRTVPAVFPVNNLSDGGVGSLRQAIEDANIESGADEIRFASSLTGTVLLFSDLPQIVESVTISGSGSGQVIINGKMQYTIFEADPGASGRVTISGLTLYKGAASAGGGVNIRSGTATISNITVTDCWALDSYGGGIYAAPGTTTRIDNSTFFRNYALYSGGGAYLEGSFTIDNTTIANNGAFTFLGGGALTARLPSGTTGVIRNSTVSGNEITGDGGAIRVTANGGSFQLLNSTVSGNFTGGNTAGAYFDLSKNSTAAIVSSTFFNNTAKLSDLYTDKGANLLVAGDGTGSVTIANSVFQNELARPNVIRTDGTLNASFSLFQSVPAAGTINGTNTNNITGVDPLLGPLADNGGPTQTHLPLAGSPLINAGTPNFAPSPDVDQRGKPRVAGGRLDIGAVEVEPDPVVPPIGLPTVITIGPGSGGGSSVVVQNADGTTKTTLDTFTGTTGGIRTATADVNNDGVADYIVGTGPGSLARFRVYNGVTLALIAEVVPFLDFTGGVYVAAGDFNGDGFAEVVVTPDEGGGPVVAVYRGVNLASGNAVELVRFFGIQDDAFRGGARAAVGDINGDTVPDIVVAAGFLGGPRVQVWDGVTVAAGVQPTTSLANFFAFEETLRNGVFVAVGDVTGDGVGDFIFGGGPGGGPRVRIADGAALLAAGNFGTLDSTAAGIPELTVGNFFAGDENSRGGVRVSTADLDGDTVADIVTGAGDLQPATVTTYVGKTALGTTTPPVLFGVTVFPDVNNGVFVG